MTMFAVLIRLSGPWGYALVFLGGVVLVLALRALWMARGMGGRTRGEVTDLANAVLFWGVASFVLGFLGQCYGVYLALNEILSASEISPGIVAEGFVLSFVPTLFGLGILLFSSVVWISLRLLPKKASGGVAVVLLAMLLPGCGAEDADLPEEFTSGVWSLEAPPNIFLWDFSLGESGGYECMVHDILGGLKYTETPCASVRLTGNSLELEMPNGVRYEGRMNLGQGRMEGSLLYLDGSRMEAPLRWRPIHDFPSLVARSPDLGPYVYHPPEGRDDAWPVAHASDVGIDAEALENTVEAVLRGEAGFLKSLLVLRGQDLILEEYFHGYGPDDLFPIASCTKSVSSLLVGLAIQEDRIPGVDTPLLEFFPDAGADHGSGWEQLTLEHLLSMSMALDWTPDQTEDLHGTGPEAFGQILSRDVVGRPGEDWEYVNMNVNLLAGVLHRATGQHAEAFAARGLFEPLGITKWDWNPGKADGFNLMDGSLRLRPRDMAKIGVMVLNGGVWQGRQVVEEEWIEASLTPRMTAGGEGERYGYLWWAMTVPGADGELQEVWFANGWGSQFILLFPNLELVVVTTGGNQENGKHLAIGEVLLRELLPGVDPEFP